MNFVGKFDGSLPLDEWGAHRQAQVQHIESSATHVPADAIIVPDAHLLFEGDYKRSGVDLILSNDERELVLHDYFKGEKRAALSSPDGAHLTGDIVNALSGGHVQYAQAAGTPAAAEVIGHVSKITGSAEAVRNGVSIILNQGDNVEKGDVIQSGSNSTVGVTFVDGSVFGLSSNARMVLNEMVYDPKGSNNSSLISLVAGTISFVAGETAKHGDMKVDTPVATMGIRGTAVLVEIDFSVPGQNGTPSANFQVLVEPDGSTGSYILFDKQTLAPIATVNQAGQLLSIHDGAVSVSNASMTPDTQKLIEYVFTQKFTDNSNQNTKTATNFTDTLTPQYMPTITLADKASATPVVLFVNTPPPTTAAGPGTPAPPNPHIPIPPTVVAFGNAFVEHTGVTGSNVHDAVSGDIRFADINPGDQPTASATFQSFAYQNAHQADITSTLTAAELAAIEAVEIPLTIVQDPAHINHGVANWTYSLADGAFDFLGAGETLTLTYQVVVSNNFTPAVQTTTETITVTITGTNDVPVITSNAPATIAFSGGTSVPGGDLTAKVPTSGTIKFDDPDLTDTHKVSVALESAVMDGSTLPPTPMGIFEKALTVSLGTDSTGTGLGTINWKLADLPVYLADFIPKGKTLTLTYAVTVTDSQGATATQDVTVTITGTDTPAVVWIATAATGSPPGGLWSDASNWETGTVPTANDDVIIITDQLSGLTPSYPVTIDAAAVAKSVTMDDFGAPPPELINESTLTVGGLMEVLDNSVLLNSGTIKLKGGGDFKDHSSITNTTTGLIEIVGGMLNVQVDITNAGRLTVDAGAGLTFGATTVTNTGGTITVDGSGTMTLNGATIDGGTINDYSLVSGNIVAGLIDVTGSSVISNAHLNNGQVRIESNLTLTLDDVTVVGTSFSDTAYGAVILIDGDTTLDGVTITGGAITDNGTINIDANKTLKLSGVALSGGSIANSGTIEITGTGSIENDALGNTQLTVDGGQTLTLDGTTVTGGTITDSGTINIDANKTLKLGGVALSGGSITNSGTIEITGTGSIENDALGNTLLTIDSGQTLTLDGTTVTGGTITDSGTINIDANKTLKLSGVALSGGSITNSGSIEITGTGSIENDALGNTLLTVDSGQTLTLDGTTITGGTVASAGATLNVDVGTTLTFQGGATVIGGTLSDFGTVDIEGSLGATFDGVTVTGSGTIQVDDSQSSTPLVLEDATSITGGKLKIGPVGTLAIKTAGGATLNDVEITNGGSIEVFAGSVLVLDHLTTVTNTGGTISIDGTAMLTLDDATISGGVINDYSLVSDRIVAGDIDVTGSSTIEDSSLHNGHVTIESGQTLTLDGVTATGTSFVDTADGATIQIDLHDTLTLNDVSIHGGTINDYNLASGRVIAADIDITGSSTIDNVSLNHGHVDIEAGQTLTLDNVRVTGTWFTDTADGATIQVDGGTTLTLNDVRVFGGTINDYSIVSGSIVAGEIDIAGSSLLVSTNINYGDVTIDAGQTLTLFGGTYTGTSFDATASGATIQVDAVTALTLNDVSITGGTIDDHGPNQFGVDAASYIIVDGSSKISDASLNDGHVITQMQQTLTLDNIIVTGTAFVTGDGSSIQVDGGTTLTLNDVSITGGIVNDYSLVSGQVVAGKIDVTGSSTISGASLNHGDVTIEDGQTLTLANVKVNDTTITFAGNGTLDIEQPSAFSGKIAGISGKGDVIDLGGFDAAHDTVVASTGRGSYDSATNTTSLLVTDETTHHSVTLKLVGDYSDSTWNVTGDGHGGADVVDPPAPAAIASGASLQIASAEDVSFHSSTGDLLDPASDFTIVSGFTGKGTSATSGQIDLKGIDDHSGSFTESYDAASDTLSVSDGTHSAALHFAGSYQAANFNFTSDGHGGTIVYDPPVPSGDGQGHTPAAQTPVVASGQGFVFNFNGAQLTGAPHLVDSVSLAKVESTLNKLSEGPSGSVVTSDAHDFLAPGIVKAQLHTHDFHFV